MVADGVGRGVRVWAGVPVGVKVAEGVEVGSGAPASDEQADMIKTRAAEMNRIRNVCLIPL